MKNGLPLKKDANSLQEWITLYQYSKHIDTRTKQVLSGLEGPIKMIGFYNSFASTYLSESQFGKIVIDNHMANQLVLNFYKSLNGDGDSSFAIKISYKDGYLLELIGTNYDDQLPFLLMIDQYFKNEKQVAYTINRQIAYDYIFTILYYGLQNLGNNLY